MCFAYVHVAVAVNVHDYDHAHVNDNVTFPVAFTGGSALDSARARAVLTRPRFGVLYPTPAAVPAEHATRGFGTPP